jgi:hypothetical protein
MLSPLTTAALWFDHTVGIYPSKVISVTWLFELPCRKNN